MVWLRTLQGSSFILQAVGNPANVCEAEEKMIPEGMELRKKEAQWSPKEAVGQTYPPVPLCVRVV